MALPGHIFRQFSDANSNGLVYMRGQLNLGAAGVISSQDCPFFTVTKVGGKTGRYTIQFTDSKGQPEVYFQLVDAYGTIITASADVAYTAGKATGTIIRVNQVNVAGQGNFLLQFISSNTDAEVEDNGIVLINIIVKRVSAKP